MDNVAVLISVRSARIWSSPTLRSWSIWARNHSARARRARLIATAAARSLCNSSLRASHPASSSSNPNSTSSYDCEHVIIIRIGRCNNEIANKTRKEIRKISPPFSSTTIYEDCFHRHYNDILHLLFVQFPTVLFACRWKLVFRSSARRRPRPFPTGSATYTNSPVKSRNENWQKLSTRNCVDMRPITIYINDSRITLEVPAYESPAARLRPSSAPAVWLCTSPFAAGIHPQRGPVRQQYYPIGAFRRPRRRVRRAATRSRWSTAVKRIKVKSLYIIKY